MMTFGAIESMGSYQNLPAGCTPWKLGTDNYPTLDF